MGVTQTVQERMENIMLKLYAHVCVNTILTFYFLASANIDLIAERKKKVDVTPKWGEKGEWNNDEAEDSNTRRHSKEVNVTKSDWKPVTGVTLEKWKMDG